MKSFVELTMEAQVLHQAGDFPRATELWREAHTEACDPIQEGQAIRGEASSTLRWGQVSKDENVALLRMSHAINLGETALGIHMDAMNMASSEYSVVRQVPESARVLGRAHLLYGLLVESRGLPAKEWASDHLVDARGKMRQVDEDVAWLVGQQIGGPPDQHVVNWWPTRAVVEAFAPSRSLGVAREAVRQARATAYFSESPDLPTAANISAEYAATANRAARVRARAAGVIIDLAAYGGRPGRAMARHLALAPQLRFV